MGGSIHINGTDSSIIDTVFVCRSKGITRRHLLADDPDSVAALVNEDVQRIIEGGVRVGVGDIRCMTRGHLIRIAIWHLRGNWDKSIPTAAKLSAVSKQIENMGGPSAIERSLLRLPTNDGGVIPATLNLRSEN
jgi:hypothetical protein